MIEPGAAVQANRAAILGALVRRGARDRTALSAGTGLSAATVSRVVDGLVEEGLLEVRPGSPTGRRGRRTDTLAVCAARAAVVGVDLTEQRCRITVSDLVGDLVAECGVPTQQRASGRTFANWLVAQVREVAEDRLELAQHVCTVVAVPAAVDRDGRRVHVSRRLPTLRGVGFADRLQHLLGGTVELDKQVHTALHGELTWGAARGSAAAVLLTVDGDVDGAFALGGHIIPGDRGLVGSFGLLGEDPMWPTRRNSRFTLLRAVSTAVVAYDPDTVVLASTVGVALDGDLIGELRAELSSLLSHIPRLVPAQLGERSVLVGAHSRALDLLHVNLGLDPMLTGPSPTGPSARTYSADGHPHART